MLYCSFEPGLFIMQGLAPHERSKAFAVLKSLIVHKQMMDQDQVQIPMTKKYIEHIYAALEKIPIKDPPLQSELRNYIIATLAKMSSPLLPPANLDGTTIKPDFTSEWIDAETKDIWLDSLISAMFDEFTNKDMTLSVATWFRENLPASLQVTNPNLCEQLEAGKYCWDIPVLSEKLDWNELFCLSHGWPLGLGTTLIDSYAKKNLGVSLDQLAKRKATKFDPSCYHDILKETDVTPLQKGNLTLPESVKI